MLQGRLIDTKTNRLLWRKTINVTQDIQRPWKQPPNYPHLKQAMHVAIREAENSIQSSFFDISSNKV